MNSTIETLNHWAAPCLHLAGTMLWQSTLLGLVLLLPDFGLRRWLRAAVRYALWLVLLVKLVLPPSLALPSGAAWWWSSTRAHPAASAPQARTSNLVLTRVESPVFESQPSPIPVPPPTPALTGAGWSLLAAGGVSLVLLGWLLLRWQQVVCLARAADPDPVYATLVEEARRQALLRTPVRMKITRATVSPAVCGLFRPVILLPQSLTETLSAGQLRAVLLHELMHVRRGDVWVNFAQALLQIVYWWHPLVWWANRRIRRLREEAVDDAVMAILREEADIYAPTLLAVARFALQRPLASLGLVGILESRSALRQRIERLVECTPPRKTGLGLVSGFSLLVFSAVALPMGEAPTPSSAPSNQSGLPATNAPVAVVPANRDWNESRQLIRDGKVLYEMDKLSEAAVKFQTVIKLDPGNATALYYLDLIQNARSTHGVATTNSEGTPLVTVIRSSGPNKAYITPNSSNPARVVSPSPGRPAILRKLNDHRLEVVSFDHVTLSEALRRLSGQIALNDPETNGVNFMINSNPDPSKGPGEGTVAGTDDVGTALITLHLTNVCPADALDALVLAADKPIKYSIHDYAVVFSPKTENAEPLFQRTFKIGITTILNAAKSLPPAASDEKPGNRDVDNLARQGAADEVNLRLRGFLATNQVNLQVRNFLSSLGVDFNVPGKGVFYNDRRGQLFVKATQADLGIIEEELDELSPPPPMLHIKARFIEIPGEPGDPPTLTNHLEGPTMTGILAADQARTLIHRLEAAPGAEIIGEPEVITLSGRHTQMRATEIRTVFEGVNPKALIPPGLSGFEATNGAGLMCSNGIEFGPVLEVVPDVLADGHTINLTVIASDTEFAGYDPHTKFVTAYVDGRPRERVPEPKPRFTVREFKAGVNLYDGQTLILSHPTDPLTGQPAEQPGKNRKHLLVLVTATMVDPAGNRLHSDAEMPFARDHVPAQGLMQRPATDLRSFSPHLSAPFDDRPFGQEWRNF
jgi:beta-lactamase regulating signal transducer with metallopeptidase domain